MNRAQTILGIVNVVGFIAITILAMLAVKFGNEWASAMMTNILPLLIGCWITNVTTILNYVYGTSQSSQRKSDIISKMTTRADNQADQIIELTNEAK
jgi:hypothetical protein